MSDDYAKRTANSCRIALDAFDYLASVIGIDLDAVFRRWRRVPVIFMPPAISNKHGDEKGSINALLDDAVRAFVCGAPAAAITLCRAVAEMIIREYYLPDPKDRWKLTRDGKPMLRRDGTPQEKGLGELIVLASKRYESAEWRKVTRLKDSADGILHRQSSNEPFTERDERIILDFMTTLKSLIGRALEK